MPPDEVTTLRAEITKDVLAKVALVLLKMGAPTVDLANLIVEDQQSQHGDPNASVEPTPEPITPRSTPAHYYPRRAKSYIGDHELRCSKS